MNPDTDVQVSDEQRALAVTEELEFEPEAEEAAPTNQAEKPGAAVAEEQPSGEETEQTPELTEATPAAIEAPALWNDGLKARWKDIPPDLQRDIAQQERDRNSGVDKKLNEAAAEKQAANQERQRFAQLADVAAQNLVGDPMLAIAAKIGTPEWAKFAQENPGEAYAQEKAVEAHFAKLQQVDAERQRIQMAQFNDALAKGEVEITRAIPEWKDEGKRKELGKQFVETATKYGYAPKELEGMTDHRQILILRDLTELAKLRAAQKTLVDKRTPTPQARTLRPGSGEVATSQSARVKALKSTALRTGKEQDSVNAVLAIVGDS